MAVNTAKKRGGRKPMLPKNSADLERLRSLATVCGRNQMPHSTRSTDTASTEDSCSMMVTAAPLN